MSWVKFLCLAFWQAWSHLVSLNVAWGKCICAIAAAARARCAAAGTSRRTPASAPQTTPSPEPAHPAPGRRRTSGPRRSARAPARSSAWHTSRRPPAPGAARQCADCSPNPRAPCEHRGRRRARAPARARQTKPPQTRTTPRARRRARCDDELSRFQGYLTSHRPLSHNSPRNAGSHPSWLFPRSVEAVPRYPRSADGWHGVLASPTMSRPSGDWPGWQRVLSTRRCATPCGLPALARAR